MAGDVVKSMCRACVNQCSIEVRRDRGGALEVTGNPSNPVFRGYTCVKGRAQPDLLVDPRRLLHPLRRADDGSHEVASSGRALDEISDRLSQILAESGPRAIASYWGTMVVASGGVSLPFHNAFMDAIGSEMRFDPNTIDKGGKQTAAAHLGRWDAPAQGFDDPDVIFLIGINPWLTVTGFPSGPPARWMLDQIDRGCTIIVADPRETEVATRADHFLQVTPGSDVLLLASIVKVILAEGLYDSAFVAEHTTGIDDLTEALCDLDVADAARVAGVAADSIAVVARSYAAGRRGYIMAGTGPNMSGPGTLIEYLVLVIETLCGRWMREGDALTAAPTLLPATPCRAQAHSPRTNPESERLRVRGLTRSAAGMPTAALAEEILTPGEGQVRALVSWGGNPVLAFPDQELTVAALKSLDLFVHIDPWYTETARLADYVLAPTLPLEVPGSSIMLEWMTSKSTGYGLGRSYAQYTPAVTTPPDGADLLEEWEVFYEIMRRMGHPIEVTPLGWGPDSGTVRFDHKPTTDELIDVFASKGRVRLDDVKRHPGGQVFPDDRARVLPAERGHRGHLDIGSEPMLRELGDILGQHAPPAPAGHPFRLLCRRVNHTYNSSYNVPGTNRGIPYNPLFMNPDDMAHNGIADGMPVLIRSASGEVRAFAHTDTHLRQGCVSMAFAYGAPSGRRIDPLVAGSSVNRLTRTDDGVDPFTGQPRMSNIPVDVIPAT